MLSPWFSGFPIIMEKVWMELFITSTKGKIHKGND